tara:strand:+ start:472 stop:705 length:234 start_codon:yes stop_codon:yes gene_type:complete
MPTSDIQKRATAKWTAKTENKIKLYNNVMRFRENNYDKYLETQRLASTKYYAKKRGYECYDDYICDVSIIYVRKLFI